MPTVCGRTSTMTITGRAMYRLNNSLISKSDARSFGPVWYHPIMRSRAVASRRRGGGLSGTSNEPGEGGIRRARTVDLLEHLEHPLDVIVVEEPCLGIFVVLLKRHSERVGHID